MTSERRSKLWPLRLRVFLFGIGTSVAVFGCFVARVVLGNTLQGGLLRRPDTLDQILVWLLVCLNPLLALVGRASFFLPAPFRSSGLGLAVIAACDLAAFLGGWWLIALAVDRLCKRRVKVAV